MLAAGLNGGTMGTPDFDPFPDRPRPRYWWTCPACRRDNDASKYSCSQCGTVFPVDVKRWMAQPPEPPRPTPTWAKVLARIRPIARWLIVLVGAIFSLEILRVLFGDFYERLARARGDPFLNLILPRILLMLLIQGCILLLGWSWHLRNGARKGGPS